MKEWKEGNVLFNDAPNTFYLRLYDVGRPDNKTRGYGYCYLIPTPNIARTRTRTHKRKLN